MSGPYNMHRPLALDPGPPQTPTWLGRTGLDLWRSYRGSPGAAVARLPHGTRARGTRARSDARADALCGRCERKRGGLDEKSMGGSVRKMYGTMKNLNVSKTQLGVSNSV